ncbi:MAG TPA: hypothetical protein VD816_02360 [Ohtaekwangia sp.]|nr:hypothetical protein [Ohtaekwangia sp.]
MASCDPIHFTGISAAVFNNVRAELTGNGFDLSGPSGVVHGPYGIVLRYNWDEGTERLDIEILDKNFFVTCGQIRAQLDKAFSRFGSTPQNLA